MHVAAHCLNNSLQTSQNLILQNKAVKKFGIVLYQTCEVERDDLGSIMLKRETLHNNMDEQRKRRRVSFHSMRKG